MNWGKHLWFGAAACLPSVMSLRAEGKQHKLGKSLRLWDQRGSLQLNREKSGSLIRENAVIGSMKLDLKKEKKGNGGKMWCLEENREGCV